MLSGASQYLVWTHLIKDFPVNLLSLGAWPHHDAFLAAAFIGGSTFTWLDSTTLDLTLNKQC